MSKEAMQQAMEALKESIDVPCYGGHPRQEAAYHVLREALANEALDRMAENARELGLDYEPAQQEPVAWMYELIVDGDICQVDCTTVNWNLEYQPFGRAGIDFKDGGKVTKTPLYTSPPAQQEPMAWVDLIKEADAIVRGKVLWKRFIDGTPLANDIACWMVDFAQQYISPPQQRTWVGLTDEEMNAALDYWSEDERSAYGGAHAADGEYVSMIDTWRYIEAKLKEKNT